MYTDGGRAFSCSGIDLASQVTGQAEASELGCVVQVRAQQTQRQQRETDQLAEQRHGARRGDAVGHELGRVEGQPEELGGDEQGARGDAGRAGDAEEVAVRRLGGGGVRGGHVGLRWSGATTVPRQHGASRRSQD